MRFLANMVIAKLSPTGSYDQTRHAQGRYLVPLSYYPPCCSLVPLAGGGQTGMLDATWENV
jgi:hypothetical protein